MAKRYVCFCFFIVTVVKDTENKIVLAVCFLNDDSGLYTIAQVGGRRGC